MLTKPYIERPLPNDEGISDLPMLCDSDSSLCAPTPPASLSHWYRITPYIQCSYTKFSVNGVGQLKTLCAFVTPSIFDFEQSVTEMWCSSYSD
ncbi:hypothetical protein AVEN_63407-1 [Araneus ventricosus]|uniref:Uncharacterized protein n=1 Tax=Araneus ventricosus TaxID=182803 RepID=A0A4Y2K823_ARAVE|nr:hypothetical protein AVEN_63407-1 [Araneus ventricosus]